MIQFSSNYSSEILNIFNYNVPESNPEPVINSLLRLFFPTGYFQPPDQITDQREVLLYNYTNIFKKNINTTESFFVTKPRTNKNVIIRNNIVPFNSNLRTTQSSFQCIAPSVELTELENTLKNLYTDYYNYIFDALIYRCQSTGTNTRQCVVYPKEEGESSFLLFSVDLENNHKAIRYFNNLNSFDNHYNLNTKEYSYYYICLKEMILRNINDEEYINIINTQNLQFNFDNFENDYEISLELIEKVRPFIKNLSIGYPEAHHFLKFLEQRKLKKISDLHNYLKQGKHYFQQKEIYSLFELFECFAYAPLTFKTLSKIGITKDSAIRSLICLLLYNIELKRVKKSSIQIGSIVKAIKDDKANSIVRKGFIVGEVKDIIKCASNTFLVIGTEGTTETITSNIKNFKLARKVYEENSF